MPYILEDIFEVILMFFDFQVDVPDAPGFLSERKEKTTIPLNTNTNELTIRSNNTPTRNAQ